ncbi:hypothetical protein NJR55_11735 [Idiomarina sp. M1R2S28]|uniref:Bacterial OB-fold domain-containing protein n=1 Tax=Idiomarina rhizosphaerae TaxID=2961572 RepID=A0A9X2JTD8_9GAMM|nr:hypothetical protein [Idiomarina rhizosphaerae]MCP1340259.1 hypothetical protein [Idiomarina rhizosphaerae]
MLRTTLIASAIAAAFSVQAQNFEQKPDQTWVSISGEVATASPESFTLDYGDGYITVEMDDWDWYVNEGSALLSGDNVTVYGEVDNDFAEDAKIEASSVYVENLDSYFYASATDEESGEINASLDVIAMDTMSPVDINGTVTSVDDSADEFTIDNGIQKVTVDVSQMSTNLLDNVGFQQIEKDDYVSVSGEFSDDITGDIQVTAKRVTTAEIF